METKLKNNEVQMIAEMQTKINEYESFIRSLNVIIKYGNTNLDYLQLRGTPLTRQMQRIWQFVKGEINKSNV